MQLPPCCGNRGEREHGHSTRENVIRVIRYFIITPRFQCGVSIISSDNETPSMKERGMFVCTLRCDARTM